MENSSSLARNLTSSTREKVIEELVLGREFAAQLKCILHHQLTGTADHESVMAEHLLTKVLRSFKEALSMLSYTELSFQNQCGLGSQTRRMQDTRTWTKITSMPIEDGFTWKKYGQKRILNAKHLRSYFRCRYNGDRGCSATKQVQRIKDEPPKFWTKYIGQHTCQDLQTLFMDSTNDEGFWLNFASNTTTKQQPICASSFFSTREEHKQCFNSRQQECMPPSFVEYLPQQDLIDFNTPMTTSASLSSTTHSNVVLGCSTSSSSSFDIDMDLMESLSFNDLLSDE